jgi:hypothetical protein
LRICSWERSNDFFSIIMTKDSDTIGNQASIYITSRHIMWLCEWIIDLLPNSQIWWLWSCLFNFLHGKLEILVEMEWTKSECDQRRRPMVVSKCS